MDGSGDGQPQPQDVGAVEERIDALAEFYKAAQDMAAERSGPIPWNGAEGWQLTANAMARDQFEGIKKECAGRGLVWEKYLSEIWKEIMEDLWGPQWRKNLRASSSSRQKAVEAVTTGPSQTSSAARLATL